MLLKKGAVRISITNRNIKWHLSQKYLNGVVSNACFQLLRGIAGIIKQMINATSVIINITSNVIIKYILFCQFSYLKVNLF